mmetsp:Transcript_74137/g.191238  ORF Transcript_74137/g.191238 Transcript_74137/m.191238 type:complete len:349 (+) Transcript_74137:4136-5182(+)
MPHHAHLVQRRLPVEDDVVAVLHVPLDLPTNLQLVRRGRQVGDHAEVDAPRALIAALVADNVPRAGPRHRAVGHQPLQILLVVRRHALGEGQVEGDGPGHAHALGVDVRVSADDTSRAVVHALSHQSASEPALLGLQPLADRLQRPLRLRRGLRDADNAVVVEGVDVILQELGELHHDALGSAGFDLRLEHAIGLDDIHDLRGDIVLAARRAEGDRRAHVRRRDGEVRQDELLGRILPRVEAHALYVLVADALEDRQRLQGRERPLAVLAGELPVAFITLGEGDHHDRSIYEVARLQVPAAAAELRVVGAAQGFLGARLRHSAAALLRAAAEHHGLTLLLHAAHLHRV